MFQTINWFIKSRRASSIDDYETWIAGGVATTLNVMDNTGDSRATVLIFYGNRVDDIRIQGDVINTLQARMGTGGGNMPIVAYPIQDGREMDKSQNGLGVGGENDPAYTLDRTGGQAVAIQGNMIGRADTAGPQGKGFTDEGDPMFTLTKTDIHAVAFDTYNQTISDKNKTLNSAATDVDHTGAIWKGTMVRRLTPIECERLQGFPDNWTENQADTHRYKQMGNAVAVPVVSWLVNRLMEAANDLD